MLAVLRGSEADTSRIKVEEWERAIRVPNVQLESLARILRIHPVSAP
jgi:DNA-binding transcriptional regulator YiaG